MKFLHWPEPPPRTSGRFIPVFGHTPALRQRRRLTWEQRLQYNALPSECSIDIRIEGALETWVPIALAAGAQMEV